MATKKQVSVLVICITIALFVGALLWGCPGGVVRTAAAAQAQPAAKNPFADAFNRFDERFKERTVRTIELFDTVTAEKRADLLPAVIGGATFLRVTPDGTLVPATLSAPQAVAYREYVDVILEAGDILFKINWTLGDRSFSNIGIASSDLQPKFEPVLGTLAYRVERSTVAVPRAALAARSVVLASLVPRGLLQPQSNPPAPRAALIVYNMFNVNVASASLEIVLLGNALTDEFRSGLSRPLWTVSGEPTQKLLTRRGRCMDASAKITWASHIPNVKLSGGAGIEFGATLGLVMHQGQEILRVRRCR